jgi:hypothetical protein
MIEIPLCCTPNRLNSRPLKLLLIVLIARGVLIPAVGQANPSPAAQDKIRVILGEDTMVPGYQVTIPCELESPTEVQVGKIELEVTYPTAKTTFESVRRGLISDQIDAKIDFKVEVAATSGFSTIKMSVQPKQKTAIPAGFLFDMVFSISKDMATNDPPVVLKNSARVFPLADLSKPMSEVESKDGLIRVVAEPPPVSSCFFYMH